MAHPCWTILFASLLGAVNSAQPALPTLRTAQQIRHLTRDQANRRYPAVLRGVITFKDDQGFFLQDSTEAIATDEPALAHLVNAGDFIELVGYTAAPDFAPQMEGQHLTVLRTAALPVPIRPAFEQMASTELDSQWVEIEGIVSAVTQDEGNAALEVKVSGGSVLARIPSMPLGAGAGLVDSRVRIRGNCGAVYNERNQWVGVRLFVPGMAQVKVIERGPPDPYALPVRPIADLLGFNLGETGGHRVRIRGAVTFQATGQALVIADNTEDIYIRTQQTTPLPLGEQVDVVGFLAPGEYTNILQHAVFRSVAAGRPLAPKDVTPEEVLKGNHDTMLMRLRATLVGRSHYANRPVLTMQAGTQTFDAEMWSPRAASIAGQLRDGSRLALTGICLIQPDEAHIPRGFRLLLRSPEDIVVLAKPSWWTFGRMATVLVLFAMLIAGSLSWVVALRHRVEKQTEIIRTTLESTADGILVVDFHGKVLAFNQKYAEMEQAPEEVIQSGDHHRILAEVGQRWKNPDLVLTMFERGYADCDLHFDDVLEFTGGRAYEVHSEPLRVGGKSLGRVWGFRDITQARQNELDMRRAKDAAEAANRAKSGFLANMSHEIRTPLNGVLGMVELALDTELTHDQREMLCIVKTSADSLLTVINDILDFSKIEAGRFSLDCFEFDLGEKLEETVKMFALGARQKGLTLTLQMAPNVPRAVIGDAVRIRQIVTNLLGNALKFTEHGGLSLLVETVSRDPDSAVLRFTVRDTGIGIPLEKQKLIFEAFEQADGSTARKFGGTGLGLTISSRLVEMMQGRIWVESEPGRGSDFHFTVRVGVAAEHQTLPAPAPASNGHRGARLKNSSLRVLLVEDNMVNQMVAARLLEKLGHTVTVAGNGVEALHALENQPFDLVFMDIQMPLMDGLEASRMIRERERSTGAHLPIIALTAHALKGDSERCREAGMDGYVSKPIRAEALREAIDSVVPADMALPASHDQKPA